MVAVLLDEADVKSRVELGNKYIKNNYTFIRRGKRSRVKNKSALNLK